MKKIEMMLRVDGVEWALGLDWGVGNLVWIDSVALLGVWRERERAGREFWSTI